MTKKEFEQFLKKEKNKDAYLLMAVNGDEFPIHEVFSEHDEYFELYNDKENTSIKPLTVKETLKAIKDYAPEIRVDGIRGNEDGEDISIDINPETLRVKEPLKNDKIKSRKKTNILRR